MSLPRDQKRDSWILFDWGDTLMRAFPGAPGPMVHWPEVAALPGAAAVLEALHARAGIALATNAADSEEDEIAAALARVGLDVHVDRIFCFRAVGHRKSTPAFFRCVMDQLGAGPDHLLMVGDDWEQDVVSPNAHGIRAVWLREGGDERRTGPMFRTIGGLGELPGLLEEWERPEC